MSSQDIRWKQRFQNFEKANLLLQSVVDLYHQKGLSEREMQGLIQRFEFTHELAWNVIKDFFDYQGNTEISGSRDATREAFNKGLIEDGESWMEMIKSRNKSSHTYNENVAKELVGQIVNVYGKLFSDFHVKMTSLIER